jgi:hypothetical protein
MMPSGFWFVRIMAYPFGSGGKITVGNGALKMKTPPQAVLRLRGRLNLCCAFGCAFRWAGGIWTPRVQLTTTSRS